MRSNHTRLETLCHAQTAAARQPILDAFQQEDTLAGLDFSHMDLSNAALAGANLTRANFQHTNLSGANLQGANLAHAGLRWVTLAGADLRDADLCGVYLWEADVRNALLDGASLAGASLIGMDFSVAHWHKLTLPDDSQWSADSDLRRFTDPRHPQYEEALAGTNVLRLEWGVLLLGKHDAAHRLYYPLPGERLTRPAMWERVNAQRAQLGLEMLHHS
ncbi:MAG: pentapeptide repeat-containing protein [Anaerolineae bacterium]|nr:pentapeptide repeat-containing protein [Anaerolineae bacterium]